MKRLYWRAISATARIESINDISAAISQHGYISEFKRFSDISISFIVEIKGTDIPGLTEALSSLTILDPGEETHGFSDEQYIILMHLSFPSGTGKLEIEVPDVPG